MAQNMPELLAMIIIAKIRKKGKRNMKYDLNDAYVEISAISALVTSIKFQFDEGNARLSDEYISDALFGVSQYLDRVAESLIHIDERNCEEDKNEK